MDQSKTTRMNQPAAQAAERDTSARWQPREMVITLVITTPHSGHHITGLLVDQLSKRGAMVTTVRVRRGHHLVSTYDRSTGARA
jgi:hypothetical protein